MKKKIAILLVSLMLVSTMLCTFNSCKKDPVNTETENTETNNTVVDEGANQKAQYNQAAEDLNGFVLDVLAVKSGSWNMHTDFAPTEFTGDTINKAVYNRNELVKSQYNADIVAHEDAADIYSAASKLQMDTLSGAPVYDAAYIQGDDAAWLASEGGLHNLYSVSELQLSEDWWSNVVNEGCTIGTGKYKTLYFTQSNLSLTAFDLTWCIYFNKDMHVNNNVEDLYALAREGKWTVEAMQTIAKQVCNLNGDENFAYKTDGKAVYGVTSYWNGAKAMLFGGNPQYIITNSDGDPESNVNNERFINLAQDLAGFFGKPGSDGVFTYGQEDPAGSTAGTSEAYKKIFNSERAMFCIAEVKSSVTDFKTLTKEFGILPTPKYDEAQNGYLSWVNYLAPVLVIPKTVTGDNLHATALLLDALSFYSERDVLPEYYDIVLKGKGAKDSDSVEMLDIINSTRVYDAGVVYGWTSDLIEELSKVILSGNTEVGSVIGKYQDKIPPAIQTTLDSIY